MGCILLESVFLGLYGIKEKTGNAALNQIVKDNMLTIANVEVS